MLEIILLFKMCKRIGESARLKQRRAFNYQLLLILCWFAGEFIGAVLFLTLLSSDHGEPPILFCYIGALMGAVVGTWFAFRIVAAIPEPGLVEKT